MKFANLPGVIQFICIASFNLYALQRSFVNIVYQLSIGQLKSLCLGGKVISVNIIAGIKPVKSKDAMDDCDDEDAIKIVLFASIRTNHEGIPITNIRPNLA